jgi:hypothetical protein
MLIPMRIRSRPAMLSHSPQPLQRPDRTTSSTTDLGALPGMSVT